jgi:hypothetical protein
MRASYGRAEMCARFTSFGNVTWHIAGLRGDYR